MSKCITAADRGGTRRGFGAALLCALAGLAAHPAGYGASPSVSDGAELEYRIKAAYLYNFARFVQWPASGAGRRGPVVIGVLGKDPFGPLLDSTIRGKTVSGRPIDIRRLDGLNQARNCHLLFVSAAERRNLDSIFAELEGAGVLTVSEIDSFVDKGGMINFVIEDERVVIDINLDAARRSGLDISSQLLKVARTVKYERR